MEMEEWTREQWEELVKTQDVTAFYLYTPMCGTCMVASQMMEVIEQLLPNVAIGKANINYLGEFAFDYKVESVPCLLISRDGEVVEKIYAFKSVPNLYEKLKM